MNAPPGGGGQVTCLMAPPYYVTDRLPLERKRPAVGSQVFVPGSQGTAWGLGSEKHTSRAPDETIRLSSTVVYTQTLPPVDR